MQVLIVGDTGGIGGAVAALLRHQGHYVLGLSRSADGMDLRDPDSIDAVFEKVEGPFDLVVIATGQLHGAGNAPEKSLKALTVQAMADQFAVNTIGPAMILRQLPRILPKNHPSKVAVLTARVGSIGDNNMGGWYSYRAAKAATNQVVRSAAIELGRSHKQACVIAYHPGTVATAFTANYQAAHNTVSPDQAAQNMMQVLDQLTPAETGGFYDWAGQVVPW
ncbi:short-subunit dehydrogenase [Pacificibacter maritimus]|uniref:Short-subunit dehydrogenase n=1 Tax=Pacificibacter maritimus TaxID=762213 RepID=A0A3N4UR64_9RHOB|nr:SDR family NAD(P)-dependent oxidoreductase [Pacificibacter maritimus]RPE67447.1 short-subunit dehydrogenase [Pacificibacter maritimus]